MIDSRRMSPDNKKEPCIVIECSNDSSVDLRVSVRDPSVRHLFNSQGIPKMKNKSSLAASIPFDVDQEGKHGSLTNIFSAWNGMVGSGLVFAPWAY